LNCFVRLLALLHNSQAVDNKNEFLWHFYNNFRLSQGQLKTYATTPRLRLFLLFAAVKIAGLYTMVSFDEMSLAVALPLIWDGETQALFAAVMAFWFGQRALGKSR
jgi:hypothetical protein